MHEEQGVLKETTCPKWSQGVLTFRTFAPQRSLPNIKKNQSNFFLFFYFLFYFYFLCLVICGGYLLGSMRLKREKEMILRHLRKDNTHAYRHSFT
jgi:hypothetical protein